MAEPKATYEDFLLSFDDDEASELSHLNLPSDPTISKPKIEFQLRLAASEWLSWFGVTHYDQAPVECTGSAIKCEIAIARYAMDYLNPREDVKDRVDFCREIARDWKEDELAKAKLPDGGSSVGQEDVMSIFTI